MGKDVVKIATCVSLTRECKDLLVQGKKLKGISKSAVIEMAVREIVHRWTMESALK